MSENFLVLGSNSFSGSHFIDTLLSKGHRVVGVSRSPEYHRVFLPYKSNDQLNRFQFIQADLNNDLERIMNIVWELRPEYVVNFAAQSMVAESWISPEDWFLTNTLGNIKFHDNLRKCDFLKKYVHISTPEVYGHVAGLVQENTSYNPSTPYAVSRSATDMNLMAFFRTYKFPVVFTRAANVYGAGQQLYRIIPRAVFCFLTGTPLELHGGGSSVRSFIHIKDVAEGTYQVAKGAASGEIFHFSTTSNISIFELVKKIANMMEIDFERSVKVVGERLGKDGAYLLDSGKARGLGWNDNISLEQGITETIQWLKSNLEVLKSQPLKYIHRV